MSNALGISAVTAVLQSMLYNIYAQGAPQYPDLGQGQIPVSAVAPDIIQKSLDSGSGDQLQVNLFLHQVTPNAAWRNVDLPSLAPDGKTRLRNPPLALDLHYLLTAYGAKDCEAEALLGYAVQFLHETPILAREQIRKTLANPSTTIPFSGLLATSGLADQIEMIKITPATLGREELAWLWTALKADYRPTFPLLVTVVLIQAQHTLLSALPVLQRVVAAQPNLLPPLPTLIEIDPPNGQPAASLGDNVTVRGINLAGATGITLGNSHLGIHQTLTPLINVKDTSFQFTVPPPQPTPTDIPAGIYVASAQAPQGPDVLSTNGLPLAIAPKITSSPATLASGSGITVTIGCAPFVRVGQEALLLIGGQEAPADPFTTPTNSPSFTFAKLQPTGGPVPVRLRIDGIDSPSIDMIKSPPEFAAPFIQVT